MLRGFDVSSRVFQLGALHEVLEKLQTRRINPWEKKHGQVPSVSRGLRKKSVAANVQTFR